MKKNFSLPGRISILVNSASRQRRGAKLKSRLLALRRFHTLSLVPGRTRLYLHSWVFRKHTQRRRCAHSIQTCTHESGRRSRVITQLHYKSSNGELLGKGAILLTSVSIGHPERGGDDASGLSALHLKPTRWFACRISSRRLQRADGGAKASESKTERPWLTAGNPPAVNAEAERRSSRRPVWLGARPSYLLWFSIWGINASNTSDVAEVRMRAQRLQKTSSLLFRLETPPVFNVVPLRSIISIKCGGFMWF